MIYNDKVMEIFKNPKNVGKLKGANAIGQVGNVACGDIMKIYLKINDNDVIEDATFETFGCAAAIVSSSIATEIIKGWTVDEALNFDNDLIIQAVGELPVHKIHCSVLAKEAIEDAITKYRKKQVRDSKTDKKTAKKSAKVDKQKTEISQPEEKTDKAQEIKLNLASLTSSLSILKKAKEENAKQAKEEPVKEEKVVAKESKKSKKNIKKDVKEDDIIKAEVHDFDENASKKDTKEEKKAKKENAKKLNKTFLNLTKKIKKL